MWDKHTSRLDKITTHWVKLLGLEAVILVGALAGKGTSHIYNHFAEPSYSSVSKEKETSSDSVLDSLMAYTALGLGVTFLGGAGITLTYDLKRKEDLDHEFPYEWMDGVL